MLNRKNLRKIWMKTNRDMADQLDQYGHKHKLKRSFFQGAGGFERVPGSIEPSELHRRCLEPYLSEGSWIPLTLEPSGPQEKKNNA